MTLTGPAPAGGFLATLTSSDTNTATLPPTLLIPAGLSTGTATVLTSPVAAAKAVTLTASAYGVSVTATLTVSPDTTPGAPTVAFDKPVDGASVPGPADIPVSATATAGAGHAIARVEIAADGKTIGVKRIAPSQRSVAATLALSWRDVPVGTHALTAKA